MSDPFDSAEFYSLEDGECTHSTPVEALEVWVDAFSSGRDVADVIRANGPYKVLGYVTEVVDDKWIANTAESLVDRLREAFHYDFGEDEPDDYTIAAESAHGPMANAVRAFVDEAEVHTCLSVGSRTYEAAEVEAMLREKHPQWFK